MNAPLERWSSPDSDNKKRKQKQQQQQPRQSSMTTVPLPPAMLTGTTPTRNTAVGSPYTSSSSPPAAQPGRAAAGSSNNNNNNANIRKTSFFGKRSSKPNNNGKQQEQRSKQARRSTAAAAAATTTKSGNAPPQQQLPVTPPPTSNNNNDATTMDRFLPQTGSMMVDTSHQEIPPPPISAVNHNPADMEDVSTIANDTFVDVDDFSLATMVVDEPGDDTNPKQPNDVQPDVEQEVKDEEAKENEKLKGLPVEETPQDQSPQMMETPQPTVVVPSVHKIATTPGEVEKQDQSLVEVVEAKEQQQQQLQSLATTDPVHPVAMVEYTTPEKSQMTPTSPSSKSVTPPVKENFQEEKKEPVQEADAQPLKVDPDPTVLSSVQHLTPEKKTKETIQAYDNDAVTSPQKMSTPPGQGLAKDEVQPTRQEDRDAEAAPLVAEVQHTTPEKAEPPTAQENSDESAENTETPLTKKNRNGKGESQGDDSNNHDSDDDTQPETPEKDDNEEQMEEDRFEDETGDDEAPAGDDDDQSLWRFLDAASLISKMQTKPTTAKFVPQELILPLKDEEDGLARDDNPVPTKPISRRRRFLCILTLACLLGLVLLGAIGVLVYTLYELKTQEDPSIFGFQLRPDDQTSSSSSDKDGTIVDDRHPAARVQKRLQFLREQLPQLGAVPGLTADEWTSLLYDKTTLQFAVLEWLSKDPNVETYTGTKILQRYALGCFYWSLVDAEKNIDTDSADDGPITSMRATWMSYQDECTAWATTGGNDHAMCDETGRVASLHLEKVELSGTLAPELALLSNSLEQIFLTDNTVFGILPPALGDLTRLQRLQLPRNNLTGRIPTEIGRWQSLEVLSLGRNVLSSGLPTELGLLTRLAYLNVNTNDLVGTIPSHLGALTRLGFLSLEGNLLSGNLPEELTNLNALSTLVLEENGLVGAVPEGVCNMAAMRGDVKISVDCAKVQCSCCTPACEGISSSTSNTIADSTEAPNDLAPTSPTNSVPFVDSTVLAQNPPLADSYAIETGSDCYISNYVVDFTSSMAEPKEYDLVVLVSSSAAESAAANVTDGEGFLNPQQQPTLTTEIVGSKYNLIEKALYWATSCDLVLCDGAMADGVIYYRNQFPTQSSSQGASWPLPLGWYQLHLVQVDETGTALVTAQSHSFAVTQQCG